MSIATQELEDDLTRHGGRPRRFRRSRSLQVVPVSSAALVSPASIPIREGRSRAKAVSREGLQRRALIIADAVGVELALVLTGLAAGARLDPILLAVMPLIVVANKTAGLYDRDDLVLTKTTLEEAPSLLQITGLFALVTWLLDVQVTSLTLQPVHVVLLWGGALVLVLAGRAVARAACRALAPERCLLIGDAAAIATVSAKLEAGRANAEVVATMMLRPDAPLVDPEVFRDRVSDQDVDRVIVAPLSTDAAETLDVIRTAKLLGLRVSLLPRLFDAVGTSVEFDDLGGLTMLGLRRFGLSRSSRLLKRAFDLAGSTVALAICAPFIAIIALAIAADSRGPVFFRQVRVGRDGRRFEIIKFRSMVLDAEARKADLLHLNEAEGLFKIAADPRITRVGRILRRWRLDELPQLFNVWRGEMSLVGPRPLVVDEDARITGLDRSRLHLTPGMTGRWQVLGSTRIPLEEMLAIDYLYVANWSLWTDIKLLLRTVPIMMSRSGL